MSAETGLRKLCIFNTRDELADFVIGEWRRISKKAIKEKGVFLVCIPGGKTPVKLYKRLSRQKGGLPWRHTHVFLTDERFVSLKHPDSNYFMVRKNLLKNTHIPRANIHPVPVEKTAFLSAQKYESDIKKFFNLKNKKLPRFDLMMLGIGTDGHTASLFSAGDVTRGKNKIAIATAAKRFRHKRISITLPVINNAENVMFIAAGEEKKRIVKKVLRGSNLPASLVRGRKGKVVFLIA